ncbi:MAG: DUF6502 family protein [Granulosicoccus sp.]
MSTQKVIQQAFYRILLAMAKVALRYGVSAGLMTELLRRAYVEAAENSLVEEGKKPLTTRLCALTGFYRKEVVRIKELPPIGDNSADERYNRSTRVITGWLRDKDFRTKAGHPSVLKLEGALGFDELVKRYSGDMTPNAMLEELLRLQVVELTNSKAVRVRTRAYVPQASELDILQILGTDTADLIDTIHYNIRIRDSDPRFQRKVSYVHIPQHHVQKFKQYAAKESQKLLEKLDRWLAEKDTKAQLPGAPGSRLGLGIYIVEADNACSSAKPEDENNVSHTERNDG